MHLVPFGPREDAKLERNNLNWVFVLTLLMHLPPQGPVPSSVREAMMSPSPPGDPMASKHEKHSRFFEKSLLEGFSQSEKWQTFLMNSK